jgi:hypothetical protein
MEEMKVKVKCLLLKNDTVLVSEIVEIGSELGEPDCKLTNPYKLKDDGILGIHLEPWITFTDQSEIMIHSDSILTIVDPSETIFKLYYDLIS